MKLDESLLATTFETTAGDLTLREMISGDLAVVYVSYPRDYTSVCTAQLCSYRDDWEKLSRLPCRWWGINQEKVAKHRRFKEDKSLPFDLVSDPRARLIRALGLKSLVWTRRGFAVVSPGGDLLGTSAVNPFSYPETAEAVEILRSLGVGGSGED